MALSNWDTLAFNNEGKSCNGVAANEHGDSIEIYKNWVYVRSPDMWKEGGGYMKPTIAEIWQGGIKLAGFDIEAIRGSQNGIFIYAEYGDWKDRKRFAGIGCSGYRDRLGEFLEQSDIPEDEWQYWCEGSGCDKDGNYQHSFQNFRGERDEYGNVIDRVVYHDETTDGPFDYGADWTGVKKETVSEFISWLEKREDREYNESYFTWIDKIKSAEHLRFNQGDAFFVGADSAATPIEESERTMLSQMIDNMKDE